MSTLNFNGKEISYQTRWIDNDTFSLDAGYGDGLKDSEEDEYFIHIEYHADTDTWVKEVWFEDDYLQVGEWIGYDAQMQDEVEKIMEIARREAGV